MPWTKGDVDQHKKGLTDEEKEVWVEVANSALERCLDEGGSTDECDASAIRQANAVAGEIGESITLRDKMIEALEGTEIEEGATVKSMIQGLLRSASSVVKHPNVPKTVKAQIGNLRGLLLNTWSDLRTSSPEVTTPEESFRETSGEILPLSELAESGTIVNGGGHGIR